MFEMIGVGGKKHNSRVRNLNLQVEGGESLALLCPSITFLNEFVDILQDASAVGGGRIFLNGRDFFDRKSAAKSKFVLNDEQIFRSLSVIDNIFVNDDTLFFHRHRKRAANLEAKLSHIGYSLPFNKKPSDLTTEQKKMIEILRCYYSRPEFLLLYETVNKVSYRVLSSLSLLLNELKRAGTAILFLTSQWEDAVKLSGRVAIISKDRNCGTFDTEELKKDPSKIYHLFLGNETFDTNASRRISLVKKIGDSISFISSGFDLHNVLSIYAKSVASDLKAENCLVYLVDEKENAIDEVSGYYREKSLLPTLDAASLTELMNIEDFFYFNAHGTEHQGYFERHSRVKSVMGFSVKLPNRISVLVQVYYYQRYIYSQKDIVYLSLVARELAIIIENSHLIGKSFLLQESHHRIKNNLQFIISLLQLQEAIIPREGMERDEALSMLESIVGRIRSVASMHDILSRDNIANNYVDIAAIIMELHKFYQRDARISLSIDKFFVPFGKMTSIGLLINELISNSIKYSGMPAGAPVEIEISMHKDGDSYLLTYSDNGRGVDKDFSYDNTNSVGGMIIRSIIQNEFKGSVSFEHKRGFCVNIRIPADFIARGGRKNINLS